MSNRGGGGGERWGAAAGGGGVGADDGYLEMLMSGGSRDLGEPRRRRDGAPVRGRGGVFGRGGAASGRPYPRMSSGEGRSVERGGAGPIRRQSRGGPEVRTVRRHDCGVGSDAVAGSERGRGGVHLGALRGFGRGGGQTRGRGVVGLGRGSVRPDSGASSGRGGGGGGGRSPAGQKRPRPDSDGDGDGDGEGDDGRGGRGAIASAEDPRGSRKHARVGMADPPTTPKLQEAASVANRSASRPPQQLPSLTSKPHPVKSILKQPRPPQPVTPKLPPTTPKLQPRTPKLQPMSEIQKPQPTTPRPRQMRTTTTPELLLAAAGMRNDGRSPRNVEKETAVVADRANMSAAKLVEEEIAKEKADARILQNVVAARFEKYERKLGELKTLIEPDSGPEGRALMTAIVRAAEDGVKEVDRNMEALREVQIFLEGRDFEAEMSVHAERRKELEDYRAKLREINDFVDETTAGYDEHEAADVAAAADTDALEEELRRLELDNAAAEAEVRRETEAGVRRAAAADAARAHLARLAADGAVLRDAAAVAAASERNRGQRDLLAAEYARLRGSYEDVCKRAELRRMREDLMPAARAEVDALAAELESLCVEPEANPEVAALEAVLAELSGQCDQLEKTVAKKQGLLELNEMQSAEDLAALAATESQARQQLAGALVGADAVRKLVLMADLPRLAEPLVRREAAAVDALWKAAERQLRDLMAVRRSCPARGAPEALVDALEEAVRERSAAAEVDEVADPGVLEGGQRVARLEADCAAVRAALGDLAARRAAAEATRARLQAEYDEAMACIEAMAKVSPMSQCSGGGSQGDDESESSSQRAEDRPSLAALEQQLIQLSQAKKQLAAEAEDKMAVVEDLKRKLSQTRSEVGCLVREGPSVGQGGVDLEAAVKALEKEVAGAESDAAAAESQLVADEARLKELEAEAKAMEVVAQLAAIEDDLARVRQQVAAKEASVAQLKAAANEKRATVQQRKKALTAAAAEAADNEARIEEMEEEIAELKLKLADDLNPDCLARMREAIAELEVQKKQVKELVAVIEEREQLKRELSALATALDAKKKEEQKELKERERKDGPARPLPMPMPTVSAPPPYPTSRALESDSDVLFSDTSFVGEKVVLPISDDEVALPPPPRADEENKEKKKKTTKRVPSTTRGSAGASGAKKERPKKFF